MGQHGKYGDYTTAWITEELGSILSRGKVFFCSAQHPDRLWIRPTAPGIAGYFPGFSNRVVKLTTHLHASTAEVIA
jgi:hypothetical protein